MELNDVTWYEQNLAGLLLPEQVTKRENPATGWYRAKHKGKYIPVMYFYNDDDQLVCMFGGREIDDESKPKRLEIWPFVRKNPISDEVYYSVLEGNPWPDVDPVVAAATFVGSNQPTESPENDIGKIIDDAAAGVDQYSVITSDEMAAKAQTLRSHLLKLHKDADKKREEEKQPFSEEVTAINERWMPIVKKAKEYADKIRAYLSAWETKKLKDAAAQAKAVEEATGSAPVVPEAQKTTSIKGGSGRAASVKARRVATAITNLEALIHSIKGRPEFESLLLGLAQKILDENQDVLGIAIETRADIR